MGSHPQLPWNGPQTWSWGGGWAGHRVGSPERRLSRTSQLLNLLCPTGDIPLS